ncbi:MAG: ADP-ribosylglycohydrolase family protein [Planctomycetaceae bacterium]|nr:ADP-ribosylglycohydrolase family protein [Planctomycetaceae bacterium]
MEKYEQILGCLLGTAVADAVGLKREGLSKKRGRKLYGVPPLMPSLILGRGFCSDDTEHTMMVGRALALSQGDPVAFEKIFAGELKRWFVCLPAGVGLGTLRACLKLLIGVSPQRSGVNSAGNGPAMRSALLGIYAETDPQVAQLVRVCTRVTHLDSRAEEGALLVAQASRLTSSSSAQTPVEFLQASALTIQDQGLKTAIQNAVEHLSRSTDPETFAQEQGWSKGISGFVNQTVPAALYCWAYSPGDFRQAVENAVMLGGDTDSVAAITGAISGANLGAEAIPAEWLSHLAEWPRNQKWMESLAVSLAEPQQISEAVSPPGMRWLATIPRNLAFACVVITLGFRRLLPPY